MIAGEYALLKMSRMKIALGFDNIHSNRELVGRLLLSAELSVGG